MHLPLVTGWIEEEAGWPDSEVSSICCDKPTPGVSSMVVTLPEGTMDKHIGPTILQTAFLTCIPQRQNIVCLLAHMEG